MYKKHQIGENEFYLILNQDEWDQYVGDVKIFGTCGQLHNGKPNQFPCLTWSDWSDDPNGPCIYSHHFIYLEDAKEMVYRLKLTQK